MSETKTKKQTPPEKARYFINTRVQPRTPLGAITTEPGDNPWFKPIAFKKGKEPEDFEMANLVAFNAKVTGRLEYILPEGLWNCLYRIGYGPSQRHCLITYTAGDAEAMGGLIPVKQVPELVAFGDFPIRLGMLYAGNLPAGVDTSIIYQQYKKRQMGVA